MMLTSVVSATRRSSWHTTVSPSIGPFNGKNSGKQKSPARCSQKKGYWSRSTEREGDEKKCEEEEAPRVRCVYIGDNYKETQDEQDNTVEEHREEQSNCEPQE